MGIVLSSLPDIEAPLEAACAAAGGSAWFWRAGSLAESGLVVAFRIDGIEVQIGYTTREKLGHDIDELLLRHNPDTPLHKLGEGLLKAEALAGASLLASMKSRLAVFPAALGRAMAAGLNRVRQLQVAQERRSFRVHQCRSYAARSFPGKNRGSAWNMLA